MTFGKILRFPLGLLDRLNPLAPGGHWMLRNAPTFWRASFLKVVWYLLLAHVGLSIFGILAAQNISSIPTHGDLMFFRYWIWPLTVVLALGWITSIWNTPLIDRRFPQKLTTVALYTGFFYGLMALPYAYFAPVSGAIAEIYDRDSLESDRRALAQGVAELCDEIDPKDQGLLATAKRLHIGRFDTRYVQAIILEITDKLYLDCTTANVGNSNWGLKKREVESVEHLVRHSFELGYISLNDFPAEYRKDVDLGNALRNFSLESRFLAAEASLEFSEQQGAMRALHVFFRPITLILSAIAALILFWSESNRHLFNVFLKRIDGVLGRGALSFLSKPFRVIDHRLLRQHPQLWQVRLHVAAPLGLGILIFGAFGSEFSEWFLKSVTDQLGELGETDNAELTIMIFYGAVLVLMGVLLMRSQTRFMTMNRSIPGAGVRAFLALFVPVFLAVSILFLFGVYTNDLALEIAGLLGGALVYFIAVTCWGTCFAGLAPTLKSLGLAIAFGTGAAMLIVTIDMEQETFVALFAPLAAVGLMAAMRWPRRLINRFSSQGFCLFILCLGGYIPFIVAMAHDVLIDQSSENTTTSIAALGFAPMILLFLPTLNQIQRRWIEPQES